MRIIDNSALEVMASPVKCVFPKVHLALVNIAPEREAQLDELYPEFTLEYLDSHNWILGVTDDKRIQISSFVLEFLWATAYAHFVFYTKIFQGKQFSARTEVSLRDDPDVVAAMNLLQWAIQKLMNKDKSAWPDDLPKPQMIVGDTSDCGVADEFTLGAVACLLHHELAHIGLKHSGGSTLEIEKDADQESWEWIINNRRDFESSDLQKRFLLLVHAYSVGIIRDVHLGKTTMSTHPRSIDRLFKLMTHFGVPENHISQAYAFATIYLHLENSSNPLPIQGEAYDSFFSSFDEVIEHISKFPLLSKISD